jgi:threonine dehydrogenase-like Zn-dependent dehydrogenase
MKQLQQDFKTGELRVESIPSPTLKPNGVLVRTHRSLVSAGTERGTVELAKKNLLGKATERPDLVKDVLGSVRNAGLLPTYRAVTAQLDTPIPLGYSCTGEVIAVGENVTSLTEGDRVACGGVDYANHAEVNYVPENLCTVVPDGVTEGAATYTTMGAIAMQGVRRLDPTPGERICVIGLGLVGQLTVQILNAYGFPTLGMDIDSERVAAIDDTLDMGATIGVDDTTAAARAFSDGHGPDGVIITAATESNQPIELAGELCRNQGRVSVVGDVGLDIPRETYYGKELDVRISRSYGPGRYDRDYEEKGLDYPVGHVRWTENRNMGEFLRLIGNGRIDPAALTTHSFDIADAADAYNLILSDADYLGVVIEYPTNGDAIEGETAAESANGNEETDGDKGTDADQGADEPEAGTTTDKADDASAGADADVNEREPERDDER